MELADPIVRKMRELARAASEQAYVPYSGFKVGAAVLVEGGELFAGCNVENASYSLTICAERNALFQAVARGHRRVLAVAIYTPTAEPCPPCGACRQALIEFGPDVEVFSFAATAEQLHARLSDLLPHSFSSKELR